MLSSSLPEVETGKQSVTMPAHLSILLQPSSETFSQPFSFYPLLTLGRVSPAGSKLDTRLVGRMIRILSPSDEVWSDCDLLGLHSPGRDDIEHGGQTGDERQEAGHADQSHHH